MGTGTELIRDPIFVLGCSRSGTTLLFRNLGSHPRLWSHYEELYDLFYRWFPVDPELGDRVDRAPTLEEAAGIRSGMYERAHNKELHRDIPLLRHIPRRLVQRPVARPFKRPPIQVIEKTPQNSLRIPLLAAMFPDARFIFLIRRPEAVISSLMEGWKLWTGVATGTRWAYAGWHYIKPPGWREQTHRSLEEICAFQWVRTNEIALADLEKHCAGRYTVVRHEAALDDPDRVYGGLLRFCELSSSTSQWRLIHRTDERIFTHGGSAPRPEKWRELHEEEIARVRPVFQPLADRLNRNGMLWAD